MNTETFDPKNAVATSYDPNEAASVSMTDAAIAHVRKQLQKNSEMAGVWR